MHVDAVIIQSSASGLPLRECWVLDAMMDLDAG
jgi:hypothetical protein